LLTAHAISRREGFTLIELLVALAAMVVVITYALGTFSFQHQTYVVVDQVSEAQQNTRAIASLIERDIRNAGYLVPPGGATCGVDNDNAADVLFLSDADAILPVDQLSSTLASQMLGARVSGTPSGANGTPIAVSVDDVVIDGQASYDTNTDGNNDSDFRVGGGAILVDAGDATAGVRCGRVTAVTLGASKSVTVSFLSADPGFGGVTSDLRLVPAHVYELTGANPPALLRDGELLAKDVEDLQVAWFYDDGDGQVEAGEYQGTSATDYEPENTDGEALREIRINLVLRTRGEDPRNPDTAGTGQRTENRDTNVAGDDGRRRRVHTVTVRVRNAPAT
jgi:prepilin-type N-terminal cleavage/methylation domain-containing protein